jgi:putative membrane protein
MNDTPSTPRARPASASIIALAVWCAAALAWSAVKPAAWVDWALEIGPGTVGVVVLLATWRRFPFSNLVYLLVAAHFLVLAAGAKYTYAGNPLFNWLRDEFHLSRNHFDRVGHFMQGFVPALLAREIIVRTTALKGGKMLAFVCICIPLAFSAFYEMLEWWEVALFYPGQGEQWLGTQGDVWDAQWDMCMALMGAALAVACLSRAHDRSMARVGEAQGAMGTQ